MKTKTRLPSPQKLQREVQQAAAAVQTGRRDFLTMLHQAKQGAAAVEATLGRIRLRQTAGDQDPELHQLRNDALNHLASFRDLQRRCQAHLLTAERLTSSYQTMTQQAAAIEAGSD